MAYLSYPKCVASADPDSDAPADETADWHDPLSEEADRGIHTTTHVWGAQPLSQTDLTDVVVHQGKREPKPSKGEKYQLRARTCQRDQ